MENISKIVISISGERLGYVLDFALDLKTFKKTGLIVVDDESEEEFFVSNENVIAFSDQYVLVESEKVFEFSGERFTLLGKEVLDENCVSFGRVQNIVFSKNQIEKLVTEKCEIMRKFIKTIGKNIIFVGFKRKKTSKAISVQKSFPHFETENIAVRIQNVSVGTQRVSQEKVRLSPSFYIGKISTQDIVGFNNERIVSKDEKISRNIFEKAKKHNKLNQLFFAIKR